MQNSKPQRQPRSRSRTANLVKKEAASAKKEVRSDATVNVEGASSELVSIVRRIDNNGTTPGSVPFKLSLVGTESAGIGDLFHAYVDHLARVTPAFVSYFTGGVQEAVTPLEAYVYAFTMLLSMLKRNGRLTGSGVGNIPISDDIMIHVPLAKILQMYQPFRSGGICFFFEANYDVATASINTGELENVPAINTVLPLYSSNSVYCPLEVFGAEGIGHYCRKLPVSLGSYNNWLRDRFETVHRVLTATAVAKVAVTDIGLAPDASAYVATSSEDPSIIAYYCPVAIDVELATIHARRAIEDYPLPSCRAIKSRTFGPSLTVGNHTYNDTQYLAHCFVHHFFKMDKYSPDCVKAIKFLGHKLETHNFVPIQHSGQGFAATIAAMYQAARNMNPTFDDLGAGGLSADNDYWGFALMWIMSQWALHKRISLFSPITLVSFSVSSGIKNYPQGFYNPGLGGLLVPPAFESFIKSFGYVIQNGQVSFPHLIQRNYATGSSNIVRSLLIETSMRDFQNQFQLNAYSFPYTITEGGTDVPGIVVSTVKYDGAARATLIATLDARDMVTMAPALYTEQFIEKYMLLYRTIGNISGSMTALNEVAEPMGSFGTMLTTTSNAVAVSVAVNHTGVTKATCPSTKNVKAPLPPIGFDIRIQLTQPSTIRSPIALSKCEVIEGLAFASKIDTEAGHASSYIAAAAPGGKVGAPIDMSLSQSFTPNLMDPGTDNNEASPVQVGADTIYLNSDNRDNKAEKSYAQCIASMADSALGKTAVGYACDALGFGLNYIPLVGPLLSGPSGTLCRSGVAALANYYASRSSVAGKDSTDPKQLQSPQNSSKVRMCAAIEGATRAVIAVKEALSKESQENRDFAPAVTNLLSAGFSHMRRVINTKQRDEGQKVRGDNIAGREQISRRPNAVREARLAREQAGERRRGLSVRANRAQAPRRRQTQQQQRRR